MVADITGSRLFAGQACAPSIAAASGKPVMIVGNKNGELKLFAYAPSAKKLPWRERPGFFKGIAMSSFARAVLTEWDESPLLITAQQNGALRAYRNSGTGRGPSGKRASSRISASRSTAPRQCAPATGSSSSLSATTTAI
ncbi:MAG: hypothetical protein AB1805_05530 [Nitrospirota bacterium]